MPLSFTARNPQTGAALLMALVFLVLLTIISLSSMQATTLEEKMAGNLRDHDVALQAAETALRDAESYITANTLSFTSTCTGGLCTNGVGVPTWSTYAWDNTKNASYNTSPSPAASVTGSAIPAVAKQPRYFIVDLGPNSVIYPGCSGGSAQGFKIIARGWGQSDSTTVTLQEIFAKC